MARYIDATQLQAKILDASIKNKLSESREVLKIFDKMVQDMPTADVAPKSEVIDDHHKQVACYTLGCREADKIKQEVAREILSDLKKKIYDRAVYPHNAGIDPYISLKVVDAIIEKEISHAKGGG